MCIFSHHKVYCNKKKDKVIYVPFALNHLTVIHAYTNSHIEITNVKVIPCTTSNDQKTQMQNNSNALIMMSPCFTTASACNISCFFNEHAAKSFTTGWLLVMINSSDMARVHPYVIHRREGGGFVKLRRHHLPFPFIAKM